MPGPAFGRHAGETNLRQRLSGLARFASHTNYFGNLLALPGNPVYPLRQITISIVMTPFAETFWAAPNPRAEFPTTQWGVVLTAADPAAPEAEDSLEKLCATYWPPVYRFIRHQGRGREDALDLAQDFFVRFLEKQHVRRADPARGRFRAFLHSALKHFLTDKERYARAQKRGGGGRHVSFEQPSQAEADWLALVVDPAASPDLAFEQQWAFTLLAHVDSGLRQQYAAPGEAQRYEALAKLAFGESPPGAQIAIAAQLGLTPNALGVAVHRLRRRYAERLRAAVAQTVANPDEIEAELHYLFALLRA